MEFRDVGTCVQDYEDLDKEFQTFEVTFFWFCNSMSLDSFRH